MFKLLIFILIVYLGYRLFSGKALPGQSARGRINRKDDEFTDYEELR